MKLSHTLVTATSTKILRECVYVRVCMLRVLVCILKGRLPECSKRMGDLSRNVLLSGKFKASVCLCKCASVFVWKKPMICMAFVFCSAKMYAVKGLKVVFSQTLAICSAKQ